VKRKGARVLRHHQIEVLVIDDKHDMRGLLAEALASNGYVVYLADGANVAEYLDARQYDLIITDLIMSGMGGLQVLGLAKEKSPNAKLVMITGYPSQESLRFGREFGVDRYLVKPFSMGELRQVARNVLRGTGRMIR